MYTLDKTEREERSTLKVSNKKKKKQIELKELATFKCAQRRICRQNKTKEENKT